MEIFDLNNKIKNLQELNGKFQNDLASMKYKNDSLKANIIKLEKDKEQLKYNCDLAEAVAENLKFNIDHQDFSWIIKEFETLQKSNKDSNSDLERKFELVAEKLSKPLQEFESQLAQLNRSQMILTEKINIVQKLQEEALNSEEEEPEEQETDYSFRGDFDG